MHDGTLHAHRTSDVVRKDPTITFFPGDTWSGRQTLGSTFGTTEGSISAGSPLVGVACCAAACLSGPASRAIFAGGHWMQSARCSSSRKDFSSYVPESSICVRAMMTLFFSNIRLCSSSAAWTARRKIPVLPSPYCRVLITLQACHFTFLPLDT